MDVGETKQSSLSRRLPDWLGTAYRRLSSKISTQSRSSPGAGGVNDFSPLLSKVPIAVAEPSRGWNPDAFTCGPVIFASGPRTCARPAHGPSRSCRRCRATLRNVASRRRARASDIPPGRAPRHPGPTRIFLAGFLRVRLNQGEAPRSGCSLATGLDATRLEVAAGERFTGRAGWVRVPNSIGTIRARPASSLCHPFRWKSANSERFAAGFGRAGLKY